MSFLNQPLVYAVLVRSIKKRTRRVNVEANGDVTSNLSVGIYNVCVRERRGGANWSFEGRRSVQQQRQRLRFLLAWGDLTSVIGGKATRLICRAYQVEESAFTIWKTLWFLTVMHLESVRLKSRSPHPLISIWVEGKKTEGWRRADRET